MCIRFPKTKDLTIKSEVYNKKFWRKNMVKHIKRVNKAIKKRAKKGEFVYSKSYSESDSYFYEVLVFFRWYRRYSGLNVEIKEDVIVTKKGARYIEQIYVYIRW